MVVLKKWLFHHVPPPVFAVAVPPRNLVIDIQKEVAVEGEEIELNCTAMASRPATTIRWFKGNKELTGTCGPHHLLSAASCSDLCEDSWGFVLIARLRGKKKKEGKKQTMGGADLNGSSGAQGCVGRQMSPQHGRAELHLVFCPPAGLECQVWSRSVAAGDLEDSPRAVC